MEQTASDGNLFWTLMAAAVALLVVPLLPDYAVTLATSIVIYSIYVTSANLLTGYTGLVSLGQAMFWGSAAYVVAILTTRGHGDQSSI